MESVNTAEKGFWDDISSPVVQNDDVLEDDYLFVDDFLDFSKIENEDKIENDAVPHSDTKLECFNPPPVAAVHENELSVPVDELAELEWLSNFVDDSTPGYSLTLPAQKPPVKRAGSVPVPRTGDRVWPYSESSTSSSSSSPTFIMCNDVTHSAESFIKKPPVKKQKKQDGERRCSHCLVQKTPQWRTGPLGAKTLCNACGVRYKSGRLLPEYRPAISPTYSSEKHSNSHRKVIEMRRKKEDGGGYGKAVEIF